ncbi:hypothetical protein OPT61_g3636 [Boeremia exigua]|uniref:Uncharacterized protein n=1 Tax=Boeremia exigua TaxID=749465 RepID=A0ACC2IH07_9PLEO|nr:hypothetical protein OPT61_g3636 [Boeremia exigua]
MLDPRRDLRTGHRLRLPAAACRPGSNLLGAAGPAGNTSAVVAVHTVLREDHTGPEAVHTQDLAGTDWASRSSRCCWAGPAGMAAYPAGKGQHPGGLVAATGGTAAVRPALQSVSGSRRAIRGNGCRDMWRRRERGSGNGAAPSPVAGKV